MTELATLSAVEMRRLLERQEITAESLIQSCLQRIEALDGRIGAICTLSDTALEEARELDRKTAAGEPQGLLHGLPVGIKDVTETAGMRTTYGSTVYADNVPSQDALVVERLRKAGAIILGKTNTPEFATGGNTFNEVFGRTRNPWNLERSAGGSTGGGAAALASGMIALAQGTDLGGSLRIPAGFCGVVGLRPSPGLVPTIPSDFHWDTYQVSGFMARTAEDVALALAATAGPTPRSPLYQPVVGRDFLGRVRDSTLQGTRFAYCPDVAGIGVDASVRQVCQRAVDAMRRAGAEVEDIELDLSFARRPFLALRGLWMVAQQMGRLEHLDQFGENLAGNIRAGLEVTSSALAEAERTRTRLWDIFYDLFQRYDHVLTPTLPVAPFDVEMNYPATVGGKPMETYIDWVATTFVLTLTGLPVASVPSGLDADGLPAGLQIVAPPQGEEAALAVARWVQELVPLPAPPLGR